MVIRLFCDFQNNFDSISGLEFLATTSCPCLFFFPPELPFFMVFRYNNLLFK